MIEFRVLGPKTGPERRAGYRTNFPPTTSLGSAGSGVMEWDGTRSDDGAGAGGVAQDWVFTVEGGARVRVCRDSRGVMWGGQNESGWVGIGESLTGCHPSFLQRGLGSPKATWRDG